MFVPPLPAQVLGVRLLVEKPGNIHVESVTGAEFLGLTRIGINFNRQAVANIVRDVVPVLVVIAGVHDDLERVADIVVRTVSVSGFKYGRGPRALRSRIIVKIVRGFFVHTLAKTGWSFFKLSGVQ